MIKIHEDGSITLSGKVASPLHLAILAINDEVKGRELAADIDDWECALGDFIGEDILQWDVKRAKISPPVFFWRRRKFHYPAGHAHELDAP